MRGARLARFGSNAGFFLRGLFVLVLGLVALLPQLRAQTTPTVTGFVGSSNVPQTNSVTGVQAAPSSIVVQGTGFTSGQTTATFGTFGAGTVQVTSSTTMVVSVPAAFSSSAVGTTATLAVCNGTNCATGGPAITLTVTAEVPSAGTLTVTPTPVTTIQTTTATAQFTRSTTAGTTLPQPGAPSGTVTFASAAGTVGTAALVLDNTAVFVPTTTTTTVPTTPTPTLSPGTGIYANAQTVTISDTNTAAAIYYTTDGSTPTASSNLYSGPISVTSTETITAIAIAAGSLSSATAAATYTIFVPIPTSLAFVQQPTTAATGVAISPAVTVAILDQNGNVITSSTAQVSLSLSSNPGGGNLNGTTSVNAVNGIATFSNLSLIPIANGYTLIARSNALELQSPASNAFNIIPPAITVTPFASLVGVTSTLPGTFTLGAPAPTGGVTVNLASSVPANVTISPATVAVAAGQTTGNFTYTGVAVGASNLTASATNYTSGSAMVTATYSLVSLGTIPTVAPGQSVSLALSIGTAAPAGGLTVYFTSTNTNVATVTSSVFIPAGSRTPTANPQITGIVIGSTTITATAQGYAPDTRTVNVTVTATFSPSSITIAHQTYSNITLNISAPAQTGGLTFSISSDASTTASVPSSVTIAAGQTSVVVPVTGVADGSTTVRADSTGVTEATLPVNVSSAINLYYGNQVTGVNLQQNNYPYLASTPAAPVTLTATISNPAIATISTSASTVGTATVTYPGLAGTSLQQLYFQGQTTGTTNLVLSAPGYTTATYTVTVYPSGFVLSGNGISTTTFSSPTSVYVYAEILNPGTLTNYTSATLNPGLNSISVPVMSSNTSVGTITSSPVVFTAGSSNATTSFQPTGAGTSTISIGSPTGVSGFSTPSTNTSATATVTAPQLSIYYGNPTTGVNLEATNYAYVPIAPPSAETITVTSSNPAVATLSTVSTTVGTASVTYNVSTSGTFPLYIQGQSTGTTTLTISGAGYTSGTTTVTVYPSGFTFAGNTTISTTTFSTPTSVSVYASILNPQTLTYYSTGTLNPGLGPISIPVTSGTTTVGTITGSPLTFNGGDYSHAVNFVPAGSAGTSSITLGTPTGVSGFSTPSNYTTITATVTAPPATIYYTNPIGGVNMIVSNYAYLTQSPPSAETITITSSNAQVATLSTSASTVGTATVTIPGITSSGTYQFYIQGQAVGTSTITVSAPGYTSGTTTVTIYPSGFTFNSPGSITTTTFSPTSTFYVYPTILNPTSLTEYTTGTLSPGVATVSVPVMSSNTVVGNISTSPVVFAAGSGPILTGFTPASAGSTTVSLGTPTGGSGYSTPANNTSFTATVTAPQLTFNTNPLVGVNMQSSVYVTLPVAPPNPVTVTVVSNSPGTATLSTSPTVVGTSSLTFTNVSSSGYLGPIYVQGQSVGSTTLTGSAPGFTNGDASVTVDPSGFTFAGNYSSGLTTNSTSGATSIPVYPTVLNPGSLTYNTTGQLNPGLGVTNVVVTSSNTGVGTITTSPVVFNGGESYLYTAFQPVADGTANVNIVQPSGFSTPAQYTGFTVTVQH